MRGSPILRALFAFLCILVVGIPIWKLTDEDASRPAAMPVPSTEARKVPVALKLSFTTIPTNVRVLHLGQEIWRAAMPPQEVEQELQIEYPEEGVDLQFEVEWPGDTLSAMKVVLTDPAGNQHERSLWGRGAVSEVLTFQ